MTVNEALTQLESLANETMRKHHIKSGATNPLFGAKLGDIRKIAAKIKSDHELALQLWDTKNMDARLLAILIMNPKKLSNEELGALVCSENYSQVIDWLYAYVIKDYADKELLRKPWMESENPMQARIGWSLTSGNVARNPEILDLPDLLNRIEKEMPAAPPEVQWTMNSTLAAIGINHPQYRERALAIGEKLGIYRDYPVSKGCTSPFAPTWINEMVKRRRE